MKNRTLKISIERLLFNNSVGGLPVEMFFLAQQLKLKDCLSHRNYCFVRHGF
jgi:hypothetical protein